MQTILKISTIRIILIKIIETLNKELLTFTIA